MVLPLDKHVTLTSKQEIIGRIVVTVYTIVKSHIAVNKLQDLADMQAINGLVMGGTHFKSQVSSWVFVHIISNYFARLQELRLMAAKRFGLLSDGSTDRGMRESEVMYLRYMLGSGELTTEFWGLLAINRSKSKDGKSCDAPAIFDTFIESFKARLPLLFRDTASTRLALVGGSFDGASVMQGQKQGLHAFFAEACPHWITTHAVAHNLELAAQDANSFIEYLETFAKILCSSYARYSVSSKRTDRVQKIATDLDQETLRLVSLHGIRWRASIKRAIKSLLNNWKPIVHDVFEDAQASIGNTLTLLSPDWMFEGRQVSIQFDHSGKDSIGKVAHTRCCSVCSTAEDPVQDCEDHPEKNTLMVVYFKTTRTFMLMPKAEVATEIGRMVSNVHANKKALEDNDSWNLYTQLVSYRFGLCCLLHHLL